MAHLEQLPDHQRLEHGADAAGHHDERVGGDHEVMQAREERPVLERLLDKRVHVLLERQLDADADRAGGAGVLAAPSLAACINPGPPPVTMSQPRPAAAAATRFTSS